MMGIVTNKCDEIKDMREKRKKFIPQARGGSFHLHQTQHKLSFFVSFARRKSPWRTPILPCPCPRGPYRCILQEKLARPKI